MEGSEAIEIPGERLANGDLNSRPPNKIQREKNLHSDRKYCSIIIPVVGLLVYGRTQPDNQMSKRCTAGLKIDFDHPYRKLKEGLVKLLLKRANFRRRGVSREDLENKVSMR